MSGDLNTALLLLVVGMITVFIILGLVVLTGQFIIRVVNRYFPEEMKPVSIKRTAPLAEAAVPTTELSPSLLAAITAAVEHITKGKGRIESINKQDP